MFSVIGPSEGSNGQCVREGKAAHHKSPALGHQRCLKRTLDDQAAYGADALDVTVQPVALSGGRHPGRRPGHDDIPRSQFEESGQIGYDLGNLPDHLTEIPLLAGFAIHLEPDGTCFRVTDFTCSDER